jgi:Flp pilus assembly protein TadD
MKNYIYLILIAALLSSCAWFKSEPKQPVTSEKTAEELRAEEMRLARADNLVSDGINYYQVGKDSSAVESWRRALELIPYDAEVHNFVGIALHRQGNIREALTEFELAVNLKGDYYQAYNNIGYMNFLLGNYDKALSAFNDALDIQPAYEPAIKNKKLTESIVSGNLSKKAFEIAEETSKEYNAPEQIKGYLKVLAIDSTYAMAQNNLGVAYFYEGKLDSAYLHLKKALEINENYPEAINNLGYMYKVEKNYELAIKLFLKALTLKPKYIGALNNLSETYILNGEMENARRVIETTLDLDPENLTAKELSQNIAMENE